MQNDKKDGRRCSKIHWTRIETMYLINLYKSRPELWDTSHKMYSSRTEKQKVLKAIARKLGFEKDDIISKLHNLRCQYNSELRKMKHNSNRKAYEPRWEYFDALRFLTYDNKLAQHQRLFNTVISINPNSYVKPYESKKNFSVEDQRKTVLCNDNQRKTVSCNDNQSQTVLCNDNQRKTVFCNDNQSQTVLCNDNQRKTVLCNDNQSQTVLCIDNQSQTVFCNDNQSQTVFCNDNNSQNSEQLSNSSQTLSKTFDTHQIFGDYVADEMRSMSERKYKKLRKIIQRSILEIEEEPEEIIIFDSNVNYLPENELNQTIYENNGIYETQMYYE